MNAGVNPYTSPASEVEELTPPRQREPVWQLRVLHAGLVLIYVALVLILAGVVLMVVGRAIQHEVILSLSEISVLISGATWTVGQLLCFAAPSRYGARWFNLAFVLVQWGIGPLQFVMPNPVLRSVAMIGLLIFGLAMFTVFLRQLALCFGQTQLARRASITLLAGAIVAGGSGGYVAIRSADVSLMPGVGPIVLMIVSLLWFAALTKLVRSLRIETRRVYRSKWLSKPAESAAVLR